MRRVIFFLAADYPVFRRVEEAWGLGVFTRPQPIAVLQHARREPAYSTPAGLTSCLFPRSTKWVIGGMGWLLIDGNSRSGVYHHRIAALFGSLPQAGHPRKGTPRQTMAPPGARE